jgi:hypothetical protein
VVPYRGGVLVIDDPLSLLSLGIWLMAAGMWPVGFLFGACSECCQQGEPCNLNDSTPIWPVVSMQYQCDNFGVNTSNTLGISGAQQNDIPDYFDFGRTRGTASLAKSLSCENVCDIATLAPSYSFVGTAPSVSISLSFNGNTEETKSFFSQFVSGGTTFDNHCFRHTTIVRASGTYALTHIGAGVYQYNTTTAFDEDWLNITASLHRCNDVLMWLVSVAFVARNVSHDCNKSNTSTPDPSVCVPLTRPWLRVVNRNVRCCSGDVLHYATACIRTSATCVDSVNCAATPVSSSLTLDAKSSSLLNVSGVLDVKQLMLTSGLDNLFGNPFSRRGVRLPEQVGSAAGANSSCLCRDPVHTFKDVMPFNSPYGGPFSISVS